MKPTIVNKNFALITNKYNVSLWYDLLASENTDHCVLKPWSHEMAEVKIIGTMGG